MTGAGHVYGEALYSLAREEQLTETVLEELRLLNESFSAEPDFLRLLDNPVLSKEQRCKVLDESFRGKLHAYVLNFLKLLVEKGHIRQFPKCVDSFRDLYYEDNNILPVCATTSVPLTDIQSDRLAEKLAKLTGKQILLSNRIDPKVLGGVCLNYDSKRIDDTVAHRLEDIKNLLVNTVL